MAPAIEQRASLITLGVHDLAASLAFYRDGLGWTPGFVNAEVAFFQLPGVVFGLWRRASMAAALGVPQETLGPGGVELAHNVASQEDVTRALAAAQHAGGRIVIEAHEAPWGGFTGHFADPDGYRWEIAWNPAWTIGADGSTRM